MQGARNACNCDKVSIECQSMRHASFCDKQNLCFAVIHFTIDLHIWLFDLPGCGHWLKWSLRGSRAPCQGSIPNAACSETSWTLLTPAVTRRERYIPHFFSNGFAKVFSSNQQTRFNFKLCSMFSPPRLVGLPVCWARTSPARSSNH